MNNKVLMSLVAASIAAMAAAPDLIKEEKKNVSGENNKDELIKLNSEVALNEDTELKANLQNQVNAMLTKKTPIMKMSESISVLVDNYGDENGSIKDNIYKELKLGVAVGPDSTSFGPGNFSTGTLNQSHTYSVCHSACHGACHSACHGSRGWR